MYIVMIYGVGLRKINRKEETSLYTYRKDSYFSDGTGVELWSDLIRRKKDGSVALGQLRQVI